MSAESASSPISVHANVLGNWIPCGDLLVRQQAGRITYATFSYASGYPLAPGGFCVDPISLPVDEAGLNRDAIPAARGLALHGAIADAMPGPWARRCIEVLTGETVLSDTDYLLWSAGDRPGALEFADTPKLTDVRSLAAPIAHLPELLTIAGKVALQQPIDRASHQDLSACVSLPGARPKASVRDENGVLWLAKLPLPEDEGDVPELEYAMLRLAERCGLTTPPMKRIRIGTQSAILSRRFDRYWYGGRARPVRVIPHHVPFPQQSEGRIHAVSATTLLGVDGLTSHVFGWTDLVAAYREHAFPRGLSLDLKELFRRAVFSMLTGDAQDPFENTTFLWDLNRGGWKLAPFYGARPAANGAPRLVREMGSLGHTSRLENLMSIHTDFSLKRAKALDLMNHVLVQLQGWEESLVDEEGISEGTIETLRRAMPALQDCAGPEFRRELGF